MWIGFSWLRIRSSEHGNEPFGSMGRRIFLLPELQRNQVACSKIVQWSYVGTERSTQKYCWCGRSLDGSWTGRSWWKGGWEESKQQILCNLLAWCPVESGCWEQKARVVFKIFWGWSDSASCLLLRGESRSSRNNPSVSYGSCCKLWKRNRCSNPFQSIALILFTWVWGAARFSPAV
jgi:hypothetical protein